MKLWDIKNVNDWSNYCDDAPKPCRKCEVCKLFDMDDTKCKRENIEILLVKIRKKKLEKLLA